ncbi:MPN domain-containing protein isoform X2 [Cryptotermes secundus]|uniref:MPN domain-containing protein isoform X2 n=1 Tax=Cryptotermes secundus TaxID=105785 RepID=UPI000CD7DE95|nr:MPN domain-containing protein isoform X2 [Cryptotermes secundus]
MQQQSQQQQLPQQSQQQQQQPQQLQQQPQATDDQEEKDDIDEDIEDEEFIDEGQRFIGDLLPDGKIKSQETDIVFASPSAWAIHCKRIINPEKKSGCGWASVKYKGKKLDAYKNTWFKKRKQEQNKEIEVSDDEDMEKEKVMMAPAPVPRIVIKHNVIGSRAMNHDPNTLIESTAFSSMGKIQPFLLSMSTNAVLVMDFHCHLTTSEVVGYLAGHWDVNAHNLAITHAFPCRSRLADRELAPLVEADICRAIEQRHLTLVGWYHSHPFAAATPTLRDIDAQLDYQIRMKGNSDASYTPCVGVICSPYNHDSPSLESSVVSYWVMPPPETKPHEYGKPMLMSYSVIQDQFLSQDALNEMKRCVNFYQNERDFVKFSEKFKGNITYLDKLKTTLTSKFPRDQSDGILWGFICEMVCPRSGNTENGNRVFSPPEIPVAVSTTQAPLERVNLLVPNIVPSSIKPVNANNTSSTSTSTSSSVTVGMGPSGGLMMGSDIANALFATGKFPSPSSLMGLAGDPGRASLAMSNMFISPIGFKMDQISILKPIAISTTATPTTPTSSCNNNISSITNNPVPGSSKIADVTSPSVKVTQTDMGNFTLPESLDKNRTKTSGQVL